MWTEVINGQNCVCDNLLDLQLEQDNDSLG